MIAIYVCVVHFDQFAEGGVMEEVSGENKLLISLLIFRILLLTSCLLSHGAFSLFSTNVFAEEEEKVHSSSDHLYSP